ncbi:MAG: type II toxin-antitoxin system VapC family toxin [Anaerolineales bacterium]
MMVAPRLDAVQRLFLDTAPIIYFVEEHPCYFPLVRPVFERMDAGTLVGVVSPVTLAECLVHPYRMGHLDAVEMFSGLLTRRMDFVPIEATIASQAAELRACHNLDLPDALQCAVALHAGCDAFLTNDIALKRVTELHMIVLDEFR